MKTARLIIGVLAATILATRVAGAQTTWGFHGGASMPQGDFGKVANSGFHAGMLVGYAKWNPMAYRVEGSLGQYGYEGATNGEKVRMWSAVGSAIYSPAAVRGGYVIGGVGLYYMKAACSSCQAHTTKGGVNAGLGYRFGNVAAKPSFAIESRYHFIPGGSDPTNGGLTTGTRFVPISIVVSFPTWKMG
jgi:hypothetical protein